MRFRLRTMRWPLVVALPEVGASCGVGGSSWSWMFEEPGSGLSVEVVGEMRPFVGVPARSSWPGDADDDEATAAPLTGPEAGGGALLGAGMAALAARGPPTADDDANCGEACRFEA